jgi:hypothetical protein
MARKKPHWTQTPKGRKIAAANLRKGKAAKQAKLKLKPSADVHQYSFTTAGPESSLRNLE